MLEAIRPMKVTLYIGMLFPPSSKLRVAELFEIQTPQSSSSILGVRHTYSFDLTRRSLIARSLIRPHLGLLGQLPVLRDQSSILIDCRTLQIIQLMPIMNTARTTLPLILIRGLALSQLCLFSHSPLR
jgi:hypothetical protein